MTVRELVQLLLLESPSLDATVVISKSCEYIPNEKNYQVVNVDAFGADNFVFIVID